MPYRPARRRTALMLAAATLVLGGATLYAQTVHEGQAANGSFYKIAVPPGWAPADGLVIWNHGFDLSLPDADVDLGPLAAVQLAEGYAVAASSYSLNGWAVFQTDEDNELLVDAFESLVGVPDQVIVTGASLGGIVTARNLEQADLGNVVGALSICGAMAGSRIWDGGVDLRLLYDAVCAGVPGAAIPGGAAGLPFPPNPAFDENAMAAAVHACTGILAPPSGRSPAQQARLDQLLDLTGLPEEFLLVDMGFVTFAMSDLVHDPRKLGGEIFGNNLEVDYGDPAIDAAVVRVAADDDVRRSLFDSYTPRGGVGNTKIVSIHTDKDGLVIVENQTAYAEVVPASKLTTAIVVEDQPSHCGFTPAETLAAWESLRGWIAGLPQTTAAGLQATCEGLAAGSLAPGPCRYDPSFVLPDLNDRVRPRLPCVPDGQTLCLNDNRFRVTLEWTDPRSAAVRDANTALQSDDSGIFYFFNPDNWEITAKVLDGRRINGRFWVFYASMTSVAFELTLTDTDTAFRRVYSKELGDFASVGDTNAF